MKLDRGRLHFGHDDWLRFSRGGRGLSHHSGRSCRASGCGQIGRVAAWSSRHADYRKARCPTGLATAESAEQSTADLEFFLFLILVLLTGVSRTRESRQPESYGDHCQKLHVSLLLRQPNWLTSVTVVSH